MHNTIENNGKQKKKKKKKCHLIDTVQYMGSTFV